MFPFDIVLCIVGEGAGIAMGLVMLGSKNAQAIEEMVLVRGFIQCSFHLIYLMSFNIGMKAFNAFMTAFEDKEGDIIERLYGEFLKEWCGNNGTDLHRQAKS